MRCRHQLIHHYNKIFVNMTHWKQSAPLARVNASQALCLGKGGNYGLISFEVSSSGSRLETDWLGEALIKRLAFVVVLCLLTFRFKIMKQFCFGVS